MSQETIQPYDWQKPIIAKQVASLKSRGFFLNASFMGVGKTVIALATAKELNAPTLVVAPLVSHGQWRDTAEKVGVTNLVDVINIEKVSSSKNCRWYSPERGWHDGDNPFPRGMLVVLDECHHGCSGVDSKATRAFAVLKAYRGTMLLAMSATPMVSPLQGRMLGFWADLHSFNERSFYRWCNANGCGTEEIGWGRRRRAIYRFTTRVNEARAHMARIRESFGDMFAAYTPKDIPGFPDETIDIIRMKIDAKSEAKLQELRKRMPERYYDFGRADEDGESDSRIVTLRLRQQAEFLKSWWMADEAEAHVANGQSVAVFLNFSEPRFVMEERMREAGIPYMSIYGGQSQEEREEEIRRFQANEAYVAVCMMQAAGCAVSLHDRLHERSRVALISPGYDASQVVQALGRTRRVGGTNAHQVFCLYSGIEDRTYRSLKNKVGCLESLTRGDLEI